jgi:hypothetical protein
MAEKKARAIDAVLDENQYQFFIFEIAYREEKDIPGIIRYKVDAILPHGLEGFSSYCRRIGNTKSFLVTIVREPIPADFRAEDVFLPFSLEIPEKASISIEWQGRGHSFLVHYDMGLAVSVYLEGAAKGELRQDRGSEVHWASEIRALLEKGPSIQSKQGNAMLRWKLIAIGLAAALFAQLAFAAWTPIAMKTARLKVLEEQIGFMKKLGAQESLGVQSPSQSGLQSIADTVERSVASEWKDGYYLTKWALKGTTLRLEGWGPSAVNLIGSLKMNPALRGLKIQSLKKTSDTEFFAISGEVRNDQP